MQIEQTIINHSSGLPEQLAAIAHTNSDLLLVFGGIDFFSTDALAQALRAAAPKAILLGCSTAGEISAEGVNDNTCTVTAVRFDKTRLTQATTRLAHMADSFAAGERIGQQLVSPELRAILVFAPGLQINGSALVDGISHIVGQGLPITGGLAGDAGTFTRTFTLGQEGISDDAVVAIGLYGSALSFGHGSFGGWEPFGPARKVTRSEGNILHELDGEPALAIYKRYLGDYAKDLPASGLLFPFAILGEDHNAIGLIRTILAVDESAGSLILAGEISHNSYLKLMHASTDKLVNGAVTAAEAAFKPEHGEKDSLAILVSCVGRKAVMGARVDEEVEAVADVLGSKTVLTGFYSFGEISPFACGSACKLHNQTMTITHISEQ